MGELNTCALQLLMSCLLHRAAPVALLTPYMNVPMEM